MKLKTGKVAIPIEFDNGDKTAIYFNPNDPDLAIRFRDFGGKLDARLKGLDEKKENLKGTPEEAQIIDEYEKVRNIVCEELDTAFGSEVSKEVFKYDSPFAIVDGQYFILQFIESLEPVLKKHITSANKDLEKKMQKHLAKYNV